MAGGVTPDAAGRTVAADRQTERPVDIVVDGGQTGLRLGVAAGGRVRVRAGDVSGLSYPHQMPWRASQGGSRPAETVLAAARQAYGNLPAPPARVRTVVAGLTTLLGDAAETAWFATQLGDLVGAERVILTGDVVTAHAGALGGQPGVVVAAGTGAIALAVGADGRSHEVDGGGYLYGDAGGGFWIGRQGLDLAMRGRDGRGPAGALTARAAEVYGDLDALARWLYPRPDAVAQVARFARHVVDLADSDPDARSIVRAAGMELATTVAAAAYAVFGPDEPVTVSWSGRLPRNDTLRHALASALARRHPRAVVTAPRGDALAGAAYLAEHGTAGTGAAYRHLVEIVER